MNEKNYYSSKDITWPDYRVSAASEHWFSIPIEQVRSNKLIVRTIDVMNKSHQQTLQLPALDTIPLKANEGKSPVI